MCCDRSLAVGQGCRTARPHLDRASCGRRAALDVQVCIRCACDMLLCVCVRGEDVAKKQSKQVPKRTEKDECGCRSSRYAAGHVQSTRRLNSSFGGRCARLCPRCLLLQHGTCVDAA